MPPMGRLGRLAGQALLVGLVVALIGSPSAQAGTFRRDQSPQGQTDWPMFRFDPQRDGANPYETVLNKDNVGDLELAWSHEIGPGNTYGVLIPAPAVVGGVVYTATSGRLVAFDAGTGDVVWRHHAHIVEPSPAVVDGRLFIGQNDNYVHAYDAVTGTPLWKFRTGFIIRASPAVENGVVYIRSTDDFAYALNEATGALIWKREIALGSESSLAVADGRVYASGGEGAVALDAATGDVVWNSSCGGDPNHSQSAPAVVDGVVYVGFLNGLICAFDGGTGDVLWVADRGFRGILGSVAVYGGVVYSGSALGGLDAEVFALDAQTGAELWSVDQPYIFGQTSPAIANGVMYLPARGTALAFDAATGATLWTHAIGGNHYPSSPAVVNGRVYLDVESSRIYSFALP